MSFVSTELARRIESAEARLSASIVHGVLAKPAPVDAFVEELEEGVAVYAGPSSPMNKMIGVGFGPLPSDDRLQAIEDEFQRRGAALQAEVSTLANPAFAACLTRRGYVLQGFENVLGRPIEREDPDASSGSGIQIELMASADVDRWLDVAVTGFLHPDGQGVQAEPLPPREVLQGALRRLGDPPGFRRYFARLDGEIAGVATLRLDGGLAQFCGAATLPDFRHRGIQSALLRHRLSDAFHHGCQLALMTTQPGSKSQENGHRHGFELLYSRALLVKPPR